MIKKFKIFLSSLFIKFKSWHYYPQFILGASLIIFAAIVFRMTMPSVISVHIDQGRYDTVKFGGTIEVVGFPLMGDR